MPYPRFRINMPLGEIWLSLRDSTVGTDKGWTERFAQEFRRFGDFPGVIPVSSGRTGFRLLLEVLGFPAGSEIVFPAYTFHPMPVAAAECGLAPVFADVDRATWNIRPEEILSRITPRTRAIVPTHLFGVPADMDRINAIARERGLFVIEDCAHALGATYRGRQVGALADAAIFTFAMSKNLPCWGGGAVVVKDGALAEKMAGRLRVEPASSGFRLLAGQISNLAAMFLTQRRVFPWTLYPLIKLATLGGSDLFDRPFLEEVIPPQRPPSDQLSVISNQSAGKATRFPLTAHRLRITGIAPLQASCGLRQLERLPKLLSRQIANARRLRERLADCPSLELQREPPEGRPSFLYVRARVDDPAGFRRDLLRRGVDIKPDDMRNCAALGIFTDNPSCPSAERLSGHCIEIPCNPSYSESRMEDIAGRVIKAVNRKP